MKETELARLFVGSILGELDTIPAELLEVQRSSRHYYAIFEFCDSKVSLF